MQKGLYTAPSLKTEGFIHCSTHEQLIKSATLHFSEEQELVVLFILPKKVESILKYELSRSEELFPHIYGPIELDDISTQSILSRNEAGEFEID